MNNPDHNNQQMQKLHVALLEILDEVDRICRKNDIAYFLDSGTALGAIRHGGFIPWDDDIDVGMMREDYERFITAAEKELGERFFLQTFKTDPYYYKFNAKIRLNHTFFPEKSSVNMQHRGIFIDIFPFDYLPEDDSKAKEMLQRSRVLFRRVWFTRPDIKPVLFKDKLLKLLYSGWSYQKQRTNYENFIRSFENDKTGKTTCFIYHMLRKKDYMFNVDDMLPVKPIPFEDRTYMIMNDPDAYLTIMYGDYMQLPPVEKRVSHLSGEIIFDAREV